MEKSKATSDLVYEDEFSYVNEEGEIYRKQDRHQEGMKLGEAGRDEVEAALANYRSNFSELERELQGLSRDIAEEEATEWKERLAEAEAIGDFNRLYDEVDALVEPSAAEAGEPAVESAEGASDAETDDEEDTPDDPVAYYRDLLRQAQEVARSDDWDRGGQRLDELSHEWSDGPDPQSEEGREKIKDLYYKFTKAEESFHKQKEDHFARADKKRRENLSAKRDVLGDLETIVNNEEWSATGRVRKLENRWRGIGPVPAEQADDIQQKYDALVKEFKSHKVDRLVEKRQQQEDNLMMKMVVLDKMENVAGSIDENTTNWDEIDEAFEDLTRQWKKIGRVPREKANQVWSRYKAAQDTYYDNKYHHDRDHRSNVDSFTAKKENIIEEAEALTEMDDIAKAARKVNKLHRQWKKVGNLPQRKEDELWDRFKSATDAFNKKKSENADTIQEQEEEHYRQKLKLIEEAEATKETTDWDKGHQKMQSLMDRWKKVGPVPRNKSGKIWKQFKGAMDIFYDRRREHFKEAKEQQKENLKKKEAILEKLRELGQHPDPIEAVEEAKKLQAEFKDIGYVPIKKKNEMWDRYRSACDVIYDRMRAAQSGNKFDQELAKADLDPDQRSQIQDLRKEYKKVEKEVRSLKEEVLQLEESKSNFNFSDENNPLLKEITDKIDNAQAKLESRQNKLDALSMEMEDIREEA